ncbi:hypothetical protein [Lysobacter capsici]|uniref:hypothetical protein n=1 Tax=Lysobacter capsici TaxID=435897 RepID=UPI001C004E1C|nr:hypothetical protein [Lysobacter capsici]MBW8810545.1 hypothetical protein [Lysobacter sp.]QWF18015.1 hypothetical protein KME82_04350 [Lysobacter capsici]
MRVDTGFASLRRSPFRRPVRFALAASARSHAAQVLLRRDSAPALQEKDGAANEDAQGEDSKNEDKKTAAEAAVFIFAIVFRT